MGSPSRSLLASAIVFGLALQTTCDTNSSDHDRKPSSNSNFKVSIESLLKNGNKCIQGIKIEGNGIEDTFTLWPCVEGDLEMVNTKDVLVVGDPDKNPFSLFSVKTNTLVIVKDGECKKRIYKTKNGKTTSSESELNEDECIQIQNKIKKEIKKKIQTQKDKEKLSSKFVVTTDYSESRGKCILEIKIRGNGVEDSFKELCVENLEVVNEIGVLVVGDPDKKPFSFFSNRPNSLIIFKDGVCEERSYKTDDGKTTSTSSELDDDDCKEIEKKIKKEFKKPVAKKDDHQEGCKFVLSILNKSERRGKCFETLKIEGNGIEDSFRGPCVDENLVEFVIEEGLLIVGNPYKDPFTFYSNKNKANTLVILKDGICKEKTYTTEKGKTTSTSKELEEEECEKMEEKIKEELKKKSNKEEDNNGKEQFNVIIYSSEKKGKCYQNVQIEGNGIEENFRGPCVEDLEVIKKKDLLVIGDPDKDPFSMISKKANTLVILKDRVCKEKTYTTVKGKTTSTSKELEDDECDEVEDNIKEVLEKNRKSDKGKSKKIKYIVTTNKSERRKKCIQEINIEGNGVKDTFKSPCVNDLSIIDEGILVVGNPDEDPFTFFSDEANSLVIFKDGVCKKKTYKTVDGEIKSESEDLDDDVCDELVSKMEKEIAKKK